MAFAQAYYLFSRARSLNYFIEYGFMRALGVGAQKLFGATPTNNRPKFSPENFKVLEQSLDKLFRVDAQNIAGGVYPASVLLPEDPFQHYKRLPRLIWDGLQITRRRQKNQTKHFDPKAEARAAKLPEYYRRNFHFQTDGYLSDHSADLYEHQVELLFAGTADAMRRLIIKPMKKSLNAETGEGLKFLELAAGTGRASRFVRQAFPQAKLVISDLSSPYLKTARKKLESFDDISYVEAAAEDLPFKDQEFDAVFSVFLFHELPMEIRKEVVKESFRVLKSGGFMGAVDSLQLGDTKELDLALENFPKEFHEPFFTNYVKNPLEEIWATGKAGKQNVESEIGFLSKVVWTKKE